VSLRLAAESWAADGTNRSTASFIVAGVVVGDSRLMAVRCLIVDDSDEFLASASRLLEAQGMKVVACATSSGEALQLAEDLAPDVVLVDVELGDEDGVVLAQELKARTPSTRAILISAHDREELGLLTNGVEFLPKSRLGAAAIEKLL
jgi:two-component system, NarL family, nitrate/nitrite response regulator NarL